MLHPVGPLIFRKNPKAGPLLGRLVYCGSCVLTQGAQLGVEILRQETVIA